MFHVISDFFLRFKSLEANIGYSFSPLLKFPNCLHCQSPFAIDVVLEVTPHNQSFLLGKMQFLARLVHRSFRKVERFADWMTGAAGPVFVVLCLVLVCIGVWTFCELVPFERQKKKRAWFHY